MKTLDIIAKEWFDKVNGNSYFSARVTVDYGFVTEKHFNVPFEYGYGNQYETSALSVLHTNNLLTECSVMQSLSRYCRENNIIFRSNIERGWKKRDVKSFATFAV